MVRRPVWPVWLQIGLLFTTSLLAAPENAAKTSCPQNLRSLSFALANYQIDHRRFPLSLGDLKTPDWEISSLLKCPSSGLRYVYKGTKESFNIVCPTHGHTYSSVNGLRMRKPTKSLGPARLPYAGAERPEIRNSRARELTRQAADPNGSISDSTRIRYEPYDPSPIDW